MAKCELRVALNEGISKLEAEIAALESEKEELDRKLEGLGEALKALVEAKAACRNTGNQVSENFRDTTKVFGKRGPARRDVQLSRFGAYLVAMALPHGT